MSSTIQNQSQPAQTVRRGDIFYADLSPVVGSEQGGIRPFTAESRTSCAFRSIAPQEAEL